MDKDLTLLFGALRGRGADTGTGRRAFPFRCLLTNIDKWGMRVFLDVYLPAERFFYVEITRGAESQNKDYAAPATFDPALA